MGKMGEKQKDILNALEIRLDELYEQGEVTGDAHREIIETLESVRIYD